MRKKLDDVDYDINSKNIMEEIGNLSQSNIPDSNAAMNQSFKRLSTSRKAQSHNLPDKK